MVEIHAQTGSLYDFAMKYFFKKNVYRKNLLSGVFRSSGIFTDNHSAAYSGFTLAELLIAGVIGALVATVSGQILVDQIVSGRRLEAAQRIRENVSRLNYLIQIEASEAESISQDVPVIDCPNVQGSFVLTVPVPDGEYATSTNVSRIKYYNFVNAEGVESIWRCGPPVSRNGVLLHEQNNVTGVVMSGATIELGASCAPTTARSVSYAIVPVLGAPGGGLGGLGDCVTAHARSVFVCNPTVDPSVPVADRPIGDCN